MLPCSRAFIRANRRFPNIHGIRSGEFASRIHNFRNARFARAKIGNADRFTRTQPQFSTRRATHPNSNGTIASLSTRAVIDHDKRPISANANCTASKQAAAVKINIRDPFARRRVQAAARSQNFRVSARSKQLANQMKKIVQKTKRKKLLSIRRNDHPRVWQSNRIAAKIKRKISKNRQNEVSICEDEIF